MPLDAGSVTIGVRVLDESRADMTQYVTREHHDQLWAQLREARSEAADWEEKYHDLLSRAGGTMP